MKLKTNLFEGKKPSLEEGQMIYQIENDDALTHTIERSTNWRFCIRVTKIMLYVLLVLCMLLTGWFALVYFMEDLFPRPEQETLRCGTPFLPDYEEWIKNQNMDDLMNRNTTDYDYTSPEPEEW